MKMKRTATACISLATLSVVFALPMYAANNESYKLSDLSFLTGKWCFKDESGEFTEENWSAPEGDSMVSYFRSVTSGKTKAYEINSIIQTPSGPIMKLRHFREGFFPWESEHVN